MLLSLLAATFTFTATATGVEKGTPIEFLIAGPGSDRDYETMFLLDEPVDVLCKGLEAAGFPRGKPENVTDCVLWPVGVSVTLKPSMAEFLATDGPDDVKYAPFIYTGGTRLAGDIVEASTNMPLAAFCLYSLAQSPFVFDGHFEQGSVYNCHLAKVKLEKGTKVSFTVTCDAKSRPKPLSLTVRPGNGAEVLKALKTAAAESPVDVLVDFAPELTVGEAQGLAQALALVDSTRVKINGFVPGRLYFRAFLPLIKWQDRQERLVQPFELTLGATNRLVFIDEDWSVEGLDPKLTPREIPFAEAPQHDRTDTCFIYATARTRLAEIYDAMKLLKDSHVRTWYVFDGNNKSLHNPSYTEKDAE